MIKMHIHTQAMEDRIQLMQAVKARAFAARCSLYEVATEANVSGTVITRWVRYNRGDGGCVPSLKTIGKFETALTRIEAR